MFDNAFIVLHLPSFIYIHNTNSALIKSFWHTLPTQLIVKTQVQKTYIHSNLLMERPRSSFLEKPSSKIDQTLYDNQRVILRPLLMCILIVFRYLSKILIIGLWLSWQSMYDTSWPPIPYSPVFPCSRQLPRFHSCQLLLQHLRHPGPSVSPPGATHSHCAGTNLESSRNLATICGEQKGGVLVHGARVTGASLHRPTDTGGASHFK